MTQQKQAPRSMPSIEQETKPFWDGCKRRELLLQRCTSCTNFQYYPRGCCANCYSFDLEWVKSAGKGTVYTYTLTYRTSDPTFRGRTPYALAYVELDEGVRMLTNIVECDPQSVKIGMPVEVTFEDVSPEIAIPVFKPRTSA